MKGKCGGSQGQGASHGPARLRGTAQDGEVGVKRRGELADRERAQETGFRDVRPPSLQGALGARDVQIGVGGFLC